MNFFGVGLHRITYKSINFATGKTVTAYIWNPSLTKSALQSLTEVSDGLYYLDYNFPIPGTYFGSFYEDGIATTSGTFRLEDVSVDIIYSARPATTNAAGMEYKDIRRKFIEISGRYDLINPDTWEDNGADFYLNAGQKYLDRLLTSSKMNARYPVSIDAGTIIAKTTGIRSIKEVWVADEDGKTQLSPVPLSMLREGFANESSLLTQGRPLYYSPASFRPFPDELITVTGLYDVEDLLLSGTHYPYNGVVIMPPPDKTYTLTIWGLFYSPVLSAVLSGAVWIQTRSYWTEVEPEILLESALAKLAVFAGNITSAKEHKEALLEDIRGLDFDSVDESLVGDMEMGW